MDSVHYIYDGTFDGFLTVVDRCLDADRLPAGIAAAGAPVQQELFAAPLRLATDEAAVRRVRQRLRQAIPAADLSEAAAAFRNQDPGREMAILGYLRLGLQAGSALGSMLAHPEVAAVLELARQVRRERHRFYGLLRFQELADGILYAPFRPRHDILDLLGAYFRLRVPAPWVIHDLGRGKAIHWDGERLCPVEVSELLAQAAKQGTLASAGLASDDERQWRQVWQTFFKHIAVPGRENPRCQRQFMPKGHWRDLTEFGDPGQPPEAEGR